MGKKLNRTEIATLAKRIIEEVNDVNKAYNDTVITSPAYIAEIARIQNQDPIWVLRENFKKELKIALGTNYEDVTYFSLQAQKGELYKKANEVNKELKDYSKSVLKPILSLDSNQQRIIDDITIAQIDITDVQLLINTIKAKLV
jgi:hypothetical protein